MSSSNQRACHQDLPDFWTIIQLVLLGPAIWHEQMVWRSFPLDRPCYELVNNRWTGNKRKGTNNWWPLVFTSFSLFGIISRSSKSAKRLLMAGSWPNDSHLFSWPLHLYDSWFSVWQTWTSLLQSIRISNRFLFPICVLLLWLVEKEMIRWTSK